MFIALLSIACVVYWLWRWKNAKTTEPLVCPGAWPILGHIPVLLGNSSELWERVQEWVKHSYDIGGVAYATFGPLTVYGVTNPDDCTTVANTCFEKDDAYKLGRPWLGEGLITAKYSTWKVHRKLLSPAFSQTVLDTFMGVFNSQSRKLVKDLEKEVGKGFFDYWTYLRLMALETICLTALGVDFTDSNLNNKYMESVETFFNTTMKRILRPWLFHHRIFAWSNVKKEQDACLKILHNMSNSEPNTKRSLTFFLNCQRNRKCLLIRGHIDTMLVGGHDTSSNVLMFTMILLGSHPQAQEKVFSEIQEVLGSDRDVEKTDLSKLVYLEAVLKESMRVLPIIPLIARRVVKDVKLKNCTLSAGRTCVLFLFGVHKHPVWGPDAHEFKPERWLDPGKLPENPNAFAAFGLGKRHCIGKTYSMMSLKTNLVHLVRSYRIKADHTKLRLGLEVLLKPIAGHHISLEKRST